MRTEEKILKELKAINVKLQETEEKITATLRKEMNQRIGQSTTEISNEIKDLCDVIEKKENKNKDDMKKELKQHENKALRGVEA